MPRSVTVTLNHDLGQAEARQRIKDGFEKLKASLSGGADFSFEETWLNDDKLSFNARGMGQKVDGAIDIFPKHVRIEARLPMIFAMLAETIAGEVEKEGKLLLEKK